jgi:hypothetical protein
MFILRFYKKGKNGEKALKGQITIPASKFSRPEDPVLFPTADIGYGLDCSSEIPKNRRDVDNYPSMLKNGKMVKVFINYTLPYFADAIDTKTGRVFTIEHIKKQKNFDMTESMFPVFSVKYNNEIVALLQGESYHKD